MSVTFTVAPGDELPPALLTKRVAPNRKTAPRFSRPVAVDRQKVPKTETPLSAHAVNVIAPVAALDQAVNIRFEAGESRIEFAGEFQVAADRPIEAFARNQ